MKKICLSFVLSVVSVFSISAQSINQPTVRSGELKSAESAPAGTQAATVIVTDKTTESNSPAKNDKPAANETIENTPDSETVKTPATTEPVKATETTRLVKNNQPTAQQLKTRAVESANNSGLPVPAASGFSLGGLSTGDAAVDGYIEEFSKLYNVDPLLIYAQMHQESAFDGRATSYKGASGYMQLMPDTARRFGVTNIYNPKQNIKAGVKYMRWLLDKFGGDMRLALAGYNAGEGAVLKHGNKIPPYRETRNYVTKIVNHYDLLSTQGLTVAKND